MFVLAHHLVGRGPELSRLDAALDDLDGGHARALEVVGAAGIGKTRLLAELAARADARGHIVLTGSGSDLDRDLPFWVFVDALDEYVAGVEPRRLANLDEEVRAELAQVFPALSDLGRGAAAGLQDERYRINRAVRELLERLAATKPMVLMLDDVHWADAASIDLTAALLHRPPAAAVLLVLASRPHQTPPRLAGAVRRAVRNGELTQIGLDPLTGEEAAAMLGRAPSDASAAALYEESGGNPFYLEQLARAGAAAAPSAPEGGLSVAEVQVPGPVAAALQEELELLAPPTRRILEGASVAGDPFERELAASASDVAEPAVMEAIDELLAVDLIRTTTVPRRFRFRHPIVRRAVYESAAVGRRIGAHERVADALADRGAAASARAHHVDIAARVGDAAAVAVLTQAGHDASRRAPATAARWFASALRLLPDTAPAAGRVELLLAGAAAQAATGRFAEAHAALIESLGLIAPDASPVRVRLVAACARVERLLGRHEQAHDRLAEALSDLPEATGPAAVALMLELAADEVYRLQYRAGQEWARRAVEAARAIGDPALTAAALATLARALAWGGEPEPAGRVWAEAAPMVDALTDDELAGRLDAAVELAGAEIYLDRFAEAGVHAERALAVGRATGQGQLFPGVYATLGVAWCMSGHLAEAAELLEAATEAARLSGNRAALAWALFCRAFVAVPAGDLRTAIATAQESLELATATGQGVIAARAAAVLAVALLDSGRPDRAAAALTDSVGEDLIAIPEVWRAYLLELMTRSRLALGDDDEARRAAAGARAAAEAVGLRSAAAMADRATAAVALAAGDAAAAAGLALRAAALSDAVGMPVEAGLARTIAGRALAQTGEQDRAVRELEQAAAELDRCGAVRHRDAAERELRRLGQHIHRRTRAGGASTGVGALTERELEIARLIVDRRTNGEIAGELFLSKKTVETHIRNMFRKLDAGSRVESARAVEEAERG
ncbi:AAA family ATPase [Baekduia soli]|uniref:AAA family ATPase n=1 Tax=Baekduia soli TaxID=496014 RepID=A0A5B8U6K8_9ACTN|nr:AAA family ATPase [Baekduia soli]QEC48769.1 AAA family ATPase [Baekduia soli]